MGIRIDGASDLINATDGSLTIEGQSINSTGIGTFSGGVKVGTAATIHSTGQFNIGVAATIFANGNATYAGIVTASSYSGDGSALTGVAGTEISNSDFAVGVSTFFVDFETGRVGVGTISPQVRLTVSSDSPAVMDVHQVDGGTGDEARIMLGALALNPPNNRGAGIAAHNNGAGHDLMIKCSSSHAAGPTEKIRFFSDGDIQMGTVTSIGNTAQAFSATHTMFRIDGAKPVLYLSETDEQVGAQDAYFGRSTENLYIANQGGPILFQTSTDGAVTANRIQIDTSGHFTPTSDAAYDLGAIDYRWRNIYTADMQLSNEGSQNDVDGTWGNYTIQEGETDLFLINRRTGKKYKFMLEEVQ